MLELDPVDVMPEILSNESTSPVNKEIATNGALNGALKFQFDSVADTVEAFSMIPPHPPSESRLRKISKIASD